MSLTFLPRRAATMRGELLLLEAFKSRFHHVVGVGRPGRLGDNVLNAQRFEHRTGRTAGDDAGTRRCGPHHNPASAETALHVVVQRAAFAQRHTNHGLLRLVGRLADRFGNFPRLTMAETDPATTVANDDQEPRSRTDDHPSQLSQRG